MYKNINFKNLVGLNFHFKPPIHKNLFSIKISIGSYSIKMKAQMKKQKKYFSPGFSQ